MKLFSSSKEIDLPLDNLRQNVRKPSIDPFTMCREYTHQHPASVSFVSVGAFHLEVVDEIPQALTLTAEVHLQAEDFMVLILMTTT